MIGTDFNGETRWHTGFVRAPNRQIIRLAGYAIVILLFGSLIWTARGQYDDDKLSALTSLVANATAATAGYFGSTKSETSAERYAFLTFLNPYYPESDGGSPKEDIFFVNARMLAYQFLHDPTTRVTHPNIDFVVAVTKQVDQWKVDRLTKDGAIIKTVRNIKPLAGGQQQRWHDMMSKLEMFRFEGYDKMLYMDSDTVLRENMEGVFWDSGAVVTKTRNITDPKMDEEPEIPEDYLLASVDDLMAHSFDKRALPPSDTKMTLEERDAWVRFRYFSGGFWMFRPDNMLYQYLMGLIHLADGRFSTRYMEQNLLNYAFRREGPMPWTELDWKYNLWGPEERDWKMEIKSFHAHLWEGWVYPGPGHKLFIDVRTKMEKVRSRIHKCHACSIGEVFANVIAVQQYWADKEGTKMPELDGGWEVRDENDKQEDEHDRQKDEDDDE